MLNKKINNVLNKPILYFAIGLVIAYISSLSALDIHSNFWRNDESKFFLWAKDGFGNDNHGFLTILRYSFFVGLIKGYFFFTDNPFYIVFLHKLVILFFYIFILGKKIQREFGLKSFIIIFICLNYLNLFFLRDSLIVILGLSFFIIQMSFGKGKNNSDSRMNEYSIYNSIIHLTLLLLLRGQLIFLYLRSTLSTALFFIVTILIYQTSKENFFKEDFTSYLGKINFKINYLNILNPSFFIFFLFSLIVIILFVKITLKKKSFFLMCQTHQYKIVFLIFLFAVLYFLFDFLNDFNFQQSNFSYKIFNKIFDFTKVILISLNNLNPINKISFFLSNKNYLELILCTLSSYFLVLFFVQIFTSNYFSKFKFAYDRNLLVGLLIIFSLYGFEKINIDIRILLSGLTPFFIFMDKNLFKFVNYSLITCVFVVFAIINNFI